MHAISEFFTTTITAAERAARSEGIVWRNGEFWLEPFSRYNATQKQSRLLGCYERPFPVPPEIAILDEAIAAIAAGVCVDARERFTVQSTVLRATARQYFDA